MILIWNLDQLLYLTREIKDFSDDIILANYDVKAIFPIYGQFEAIRKPDSGRIPCKTYIFINSNFLSYKNCKQNLKISNTLLLWVKVLVLLKNTDFLQK